MTDDEIRANLAERVNRSAGQHQRAIREAFARARLALPPVRVEPVRRIMARPLHAWPFKGPTC